MVMISNTMKMNLTSSSRFLSASALRVASQVWSPPLSMGEARSITGSSIREGGSTCTWRIVSMNKDLTQLQRKVSQAM